MPPSTPPHNPRPGAWASERASPGSSGLGPGSLPSRAARPLTGEPMVWSQGRDRRQGGEGPGAPPLRWDLGARLQTGPRCAPKRQCDFLSKTRDRLEGKPAVPAIWCDESLVDTSRPHPPARGPRGSETPTPPLSLHRPPGKLWVCSRLCPGCLGWTSARS